MTVKRSCSFMVGGRVDGSVRTILILAPVLFVLLVAVGCSETERAASGDTFQKISFDLSILDENGLYGPPDGRRILDYEFCIPKTVNCVEEVNAIDTTVVIHRSSPGRIGCSDREYLCIGNTYQKQYKKVLERLAELEYIERIDMCMLE